MLFLILAPTTMSLTRMGTFITVPRSIFEDDLFVKETFSRREAFLDLVQKATHEPKTVPTRGGSITLQRGQIAVSIRFLASRWGWSCGKVESVLKEYESVNLIERKTDNGTTTISIINYDFFQPCVNDDEHTNGHADKHANRHNNNKDNKEKTEGKKVSDDTKEKLLESAQRIYDAYPATTIREGKVRHTKTSKDIERLVSVLKKGQYTEEKLLYIIKRYKEETQGLYMRNLEFFLNNIPDYSQVEETGDVFSELPPEGSEDWIDGRRPQKV